MMLWNGVKPTFFQTRIGWPYNCQVLDGENQQMTERLAPGVPLSEWKFDQVPSFPSGKPLLFLWGPCEDKTGCEGCPPCQARTPLFTTAWSDWVSSRPQSAVVP